MRQTLTLVFEGDEPDDLWDLTNELIERLSGGVPDGYQIRFEQRGEQLMLRGIRRSAPFEGAPVPQ